jgi:hypothetical protein
MSCIQAIETAPFNGPSIESGHKCSQLLRRCVKSGIGGMGVLS